VTGTLAQPAAFGKTAVTHLPGTIQPSYEILALITCPNILHNG
jgi:hypothetical protein